MNQSNQDVKETQETNQSQSQEENTPLAQSAPEAPKPLFSGIDSQGKERLFKDAEEAQQSWQSAQNFIKTKVDETKSLEAKVQELEAQLNQSKKLEDALEHLQSKGESPVSEQQPQQTNTKLNADYEACRLQTSRQNNPRRRSSSPSWSRSAATTRAPTTGLPSSSRTRPISETNRCRRFAPS